MPSPKYAIETACINGLAEEGYGLTFNTGARPGMLRRGADLVEVRRALAQGVVIMSDMLGQRGLWIVQDQMIDGGMILVTVAVRSNEHEVEVLAVT